MADPEFTDTARAALLWVLWHHQGGSSPTGQAVRFALGMGQFDRLTPDQVAQAKAWAPGIPGLAHTDPAGVTTVPTPQQISDYLASLDRIQREVVEREARAAGVAAPAPWSGRHPQCGHPNCNCFEGCVMRMRDEERAAAGVTAPGHNT